jgi:hypothetical protein
MGTADYLGMCITLHHSFWKICSPFKTEKDYEVLLANKNKKARWPWIIDSTFRLQSSILMSWVEQIFIMLFAMVGVVLWSALGYLYTRGRELTAGSVSGWNHMIG